MGALPLLHFNPVSFLFSFAVFAALLTILGAKVWKPILKALDDRDEAIRSDLDQAKLDKEEAEKLLAEQREAMGQMREEAKKTREEAVALAEKHKQELMSAAQKESELLIEKARVEMKNERERMYEDVKTLAVEVGVGLASKVLSKEIDESTHQKVVQESLDNLKAAYEKAA
jgi:F-type H+-transporting ATPase subunit b